MKLGFLFLSFCLAALAANGCGGSTDSPSSEPDASSECSGSSPDCSSGCGFYAPQCIDGAWHCGTPPANSCGGTGGSDAGTGGTGGLTDSGPDVATAPDCEAEPDCLTCCETALPAPFERLLSGARACLCEAPGACADACATTACLEQPAAADDACMSCAYRAVSDGPCSDALGSCAADSACAPAVQCWASCPYCAASFSTEIAPVIDGLLYMSESDRPFEVISFPDTGSGEITPAHLLELLQLPADTVVEQRTLDQFFTPYLLGGPDGARYEQMRGILEKHLTDVTVIRVGTIEVHVYLVGRTSCGEVAGLTTVSIET